MSSHVESAYECFHIDESITNDNDTSFHLCAILLSRNGGPVFRHGHHQLMLISNIRYQSSNQNERTLVDIVLVWLGDYTYKYPADSLHELLELYNGGNKRFDKILSSETSKQGFLR